MGAFSLPHIRLSAATKPPPRTDSSRVWVYPFNLENPARMQCLLYLVSLMGILGPPAAILYMCNWRKQSLTVSGIAACENRVGEKWAVMLRSKLHCCLVSGPLSTTFFSTRISLKAERLLRGQPLEVLPASHAFMDQMRRGDSGWWWRMQGTAALSWASATVEPCGCLKTTRLMCPQSENVSWIPALRWCKHREFGASCCPAGEDLEWLACLCRADSGTYGRTLSSYWPAMASGVPSKMRKLFVLWR